VSRKLDRQGITRQGRGAEGMSDPGRTIRKRRGAEGTSDRGELIHKGADRRGRKLGRDFEQPLSVSSCAGELLCQRALRRRFNPPDAPTSLLTALALLAVDYAGQTSTSTLGAGTPGLRLCEHDARRSGCGECGKGCGGEIGHRG